ncbi:MAG: protein kinase [Acidobacteria bacterium]|nr:protein kinase [Acidobacteriota bacterium]
MKECLTCNKCYGDNVTLCPIDGNTLEFTLKGDLVLDDKYIFYRRLGEGGMGTVYEANQIILQRSVAIKVLSPNFTANNNARERFEREALAIAKLKHPNIVSIHDFGFSNNGYAFLVMEFIKGFHLKHFMKRWPICGLEFGVEIARQICEALSTAHAFGVMHRDIKPENIMFEGLLNNSIMKVVDFGLVKMRSEEGRQRRLTSPNMLVGTFSYMSPEVCLGEDIDERSDIYSLGVLLYEMFTGSLPCQGDDPLEVIEAHIKNPPTPPSKLINEMPAKLENLIISALDKKPCNRPKSVQEMANELSSILIDFARRNINKYTPITAKAELLAVQRNFSSKSNDQSNTYDLNKAQKAIIKNPKDFSQYEKIAEIYQQTGYVLEAIEAFFNAADLSYQFGNLDKAVSIYWKIYSIVDIESRVSIATKLADIFCQQELFELAYKQCYWLTKYYLSKELITEACKVAEILPTEGEIDYRQQLFHLISDLWPVSSDDSRRSWRRRRPQVKTDLCSQVVFIVDSNQETSAQIAQAICKLGCQVRILTKAEQALLLSKSLWPTMIIFDMELPDSSGSDLYWQLQKIPLMKDTTYICLSSNKKDVEIDAAFNEGVDDYWIKPIDIDNLATRIKRLLLQNKHYTQIVENLNKVSFLTLLQELEKSGKTGNLTIKSGIETANIFLVGGIIVNAKLNKLAPLGVLYRVMFWSDGTMHFRPDIPCSEKVVEVTSYQLITHILNFYDEEKAIISNFPSLSTSLKLELPEIIIAEEKELEVVELFDGTQPLRDIFEKLRGDFTALTIALSIYRSNSPDSFTDITDNKTVITTRNSNNAEKILSTSDIHTKPLK